MRSYTARYFWKLVLFSFILSTFSVILVGIFSYLKASSTIEDNVATEKLQSVQQMQANVEQLLKTVDHSLTYFVNSSFLKGVLREPLTVDQFQLYNEVVQELNYLQSFDTGLDDIVLISTTQDWMINNSGLFRLDQHEDEDIKSLTQRADALPVQSAWLLHKEQHSIYSEVAACNNSINLIKKLPLTSYASKLGYAIATIPTCTIGKLLPKMDNGSILILDENYQVIIHDSADMLGKDMSESPYVRELFNQQSPAGTFELSVDGTDYSVSYRKSDYNSWNYLSIIKLDTLKAESYSIGWFTLAICTVILILTLLVSWIGSARMYKPIKEIKKLFTPLPVWPEKSNRDDFELINEQIHHMLKENSKLDHQLQDQILHLKQFFVMKLMQGGKSHTEIKERLNTLGFNESWKKFSALTIQIDTLEGTDYQTKDHDLLLFAINNIVDELLPDEERLTPIVLDHSQVTILLSKHEVDQEFISEIYELSEHIQTHVKQLLQLQISIGISRPYHDLASTQEAYREGLEALKFRLKMGPESIIYFGDLNFEKAVYIPFPQHIENELLDSIKLGERDQVEVLLDQLFAEMFKKDFNLTQYQILTVRFLSNLVQMMQTMGIETLELYDNKSLFDQLFRLTTLEEMKSWFKQSLIFPMMTAIEERTASQYRSISDEIIHTIQQEFDTDITLESIAVRMHYNANYLSSIFRKETGISFSEYLSTYRHNMAKKWLLETSFSVKDIAEKLRYTNSQNFIRSFRKIEGTTPGKFRESYKYDVS